MFFEPEDALGTYRVELVAHDRNGTGSARAEATIELVEYAEGAPFAGPDEVASWLWSYFHDPDPCRIAPALRAYAAQGVEDLRPAHGALAELLEGNDWLLPILFAELADDGPEVRRLLLWLLARTNHDPAPYVAELGADERALWERFRDTPNPIADPLAGPKDVNELLGRYLLGRGRARLHRLVRALSSEPSDVVADVTIHEPTRDVRVPLPRVMSRFVAGELAECAGDPSTRGYLEVWAEDEDLPPDVRTRLAEILARADGEADGAGAPERDD